MTEIGANEAAQILGIKKTTLYGLVSKGEIPAFQEAKSAQYKFDRLLIEQLARERAEQPRPLAIDGTTRGKPRVWATNETERVWGRASDKEVRKWTKAARDKDLTLWAWLHEVANEAATKIIETAGAGYDEPVRRTLSPAGTKVRTFGRVTPEEMNRWVEASWLAKYPNVWPWLRAMANRATNPSVPQ